MGKRAHLAGKRVGKRHSTVIEAVEPIARFLQKNPMVSNIILGKIDVHLPPTEKRIKVSEIGNGLKLMVRGVNSIQTIYVYTAERDTVLGTLRKEFESKYLFV